MKIQLLSDLHLEYAPFQLSDSDADVLVLAGDIGTGVQALEWIAALPHRPEWILYVPGNHEYYGHHLPTLRESLREKAAQLDKVIFLDNDLIELDGVRFLGATLWSDWRLFGEEELDIAWAVQKAQTILPDFTGKVLAGQADAPRFLQVADCIQRHQDTQAWLETALEADSSLPQVVITHHMPTFKSVSPRFQKDMLSCAFASHRDTLVHKADFWFHGHTHDSFDYFHGKCRVVCNPRGYVIPHKRVENQQFNPTLLIEINAPS